MILLDTHIWVWWVMGDNKLSVKQKRIIQEYENVGLGLSVISLWEIAKLNELGKIVLPYKINKWLKEAVSYPGIQIIDLSLEIILKSTNLQGKFHKDPMDQIIVATAITKNIPLVTSDSRIKKYQFVKTI